MFGRGHEGARGERAAEQVLAAYQVVRRMLYGMGVRDPELSDLTQETLVHALRGFDGYAGRGSLESWLRSIAVNVARRYWRDRARSRVVLGEPAHEEPDRRGLLAASLDQRRHPGDALRRLAWVEAWFSAHDQRYREVLFLADVEGCSTREIAEALGISWARARYLVYRARNEIEKDWRRFDPESPAPFRPREVSP